MQFLCLICSAFYFLFPPSPLDGIIVSHMPYGPTAFFSLSNVVMRHDIVDVGKMSEASPHLIFNNFSTKVGKRVTNILKFLFPVPREDSKRVMTFSNESDYISFRHHVFTKKGKEVELAEIGPRFEMRRMLSCHYFIFNVFAYISRFHGFHFFL
eukprot:m.51987 g.51987  ORF g.51987 m.51987 type:complete len:154 (-) comp7592_c0_seq4:228-689(-)